MPAAQELAGGEVSKTAVKWPVTAVKASVLVTAVKASVQLPPSAPNAAVPAAHRRRFR